MLEKRRFLIHFTFAFFIEKSCVQPLNLHSRARFCMSLKMCIFALKSRRQKGPEISVRGLKQYSSALFRGPVFGRSWKVLRASPGELFPDSLRKAPARLPESSQRAPRELPESCGRAPREPWMSSICKCIVHVICRSVFHGLEQEPEITPGAIHIQMCRKHKK